MKTSKILLDASHRITSRSMSLDDAVALLQQADEQDIPVKTAQGELSERWVQVHRYRRTFFRALKAVPREVNGVTFSKEDIALMYVQGWADFGKLSILSDALHEFAKSKN